MRKHNLIIALITGALATTITACNSGGSAQKAPSAATKLEGKMYQNTNKVSSVTIADFMKQISDSIANAKMKKIELEVNAKLKDFEKYDVTLNQESDAIFLMPPNAEYLNSRIIKVFKRFNILETDSLKVTAQSIASIEPIDDLADSMFEIYRVQIYGYKNNEIIFMCDIYDTCLQSNVSWLGMKCKAIKPEDLK